MDGPNFKIERTFFRWLISVAPIQELDLLSSDNSASCGHNRTCACTFCRTSKSSQMINRKQTRASATWALGHVQVYLVCSSCFALLASSYNQQAIRRFACLVKDASLRGARRPGWPGSKSSGDVDGVTTTAIDIAGGDIIVSVTARVRIQGIGAGLNPRKRGAEKKSVASASVTLTTSPSARPLLAGTVF